MTGRSTPHHPWAWYLIWFQVATLRIAPRTMWARVCRTDNWCDRNKTKWFDFQWNSARKAFQQLRPSFAIFREKKTIRQKRWPSTVFQHSFYPDAKLCFFNICEFSGRLFTKALDSICQYPAVIISRLLLSFSRPSPCEYWWKRSYWFSNEDLLFDCHFTSPFVFFDDSKERPPPHLNKIQPK